MRMQNGKWQEFSCKLMKYERASMIERPHDGLGARATGSLDRQDREHHHAGREGNESACTFAFPSRLYLEDNAIFMTALVLSRTETTDPECQPVSFILAESGAAILKPA